MIPFPESINNFIFIGEAGSGKSEISTAFARCLATRCNRQVDFFDLDQTKPLFRSRDYLGGTDIPNLTLHYQEQLLDSPLSTPGVVESLSDSQVYTVLDVGGNVVGARMVAPFSQYTNSADALAWFIVNPYRPWSRNREVLNETIHQISANSRIARFRFLSNPTFGPDTTLEQALSGHKEVVQMVAPNSVDALCLDSKLAGQLGNTWDGPVFALDLSHRL